MPGVAVSPRVIARNSIGRFIRECEIAAGQTMADIKDEGVRLSRELAPQGTKPDPRTRKLRDSIAGTSTRTTAQWWSDARHAVAQEKGAPPHLISGRVAFYWEREGRYWKPGPNMINHPGNQAQPYLRPAYGIVMGKWMTYAQTHYPK